MHACIKQLYTHTRTHARTHARTHVCKQSAIEKKKNRREEKGDRERLFTAQLSSTHVKNSDFIFGYMYKKTVFNGSSKCLFKCTKLKGSLH